MIKKVLIAVALALVAIVGVIATRPAEFSIERSATIAAPPDVVFSYVNEFKKWDEWSPWDKLDPDQKKTYEGPAAGVGAVTAWEGNDDVGKGKMTITESKPGEKVAIKLEFMEPMAATNTTDFTFKGDGEKTNVTWKMAGSHDFMGKAFSMFMDMDQMVGKDFEAGLATLKTKSEAEARAIAEAAAKKKAEEEAAAAAAAAAEGGTEGGEAGAAAPAGAVAADK